MNERKGMEAVNRRAYSSQSALKAYAPDSGLSVAEEVILGALRPRIAGKRLLDIGVGGGRTTPFLQDVSHDYFAIDYSETLVNFTKAKFGLSSIYCCDVRSMSRFTDEMFDFILFSFNGIDYMPHDDRVKALTEIYRVLKRGGLFMFSSHNRNLLNQPRAIMRTLQGRPPIWSVKEGLRAILLAPRHWWMRRHEVHTDDYAIVNDSGLHYSLLTYYVSPSCQLQQLMTVGFSIEGMYDSLGRDASNEDLSPWLHYLVTK